MLWVELSAYVSFWQDATNNNKDSKALLSFNYINSMAFVCEMRVKSEES